jgi:26S proteasome regulatory subunit T3
MLGAIITQELKRIQSVPLIIGQFNEMIDSHYGIVNSTAGSTYYVRVLSTLDREKLKPNTSIALHRHSHAVVDILPPESDSSIQLMVEKPDVTYHDIGGNDIQKQEVSYRTAASVISEFTALQRNLGRANRFERLWSCR